MLWLLIGFILAFAVGLLGIFPSVHINNLLPLLLIFVKDPLISSVAIVSGSIIFCFTSYIANALFFVPSDSNFVSLMPMQRLYNEGKAYYAIYLSAIGSLYGFILGLPLILLFIFCLPFLKPIITFLTPIVLIATLLLLALSVKNVFGYLTIIFSSLLGLVVMFFPINIKNPLFVLIIGLFGISSIYIAIITKTQSIKQHLDLFPISTLKKIHIAIISSVLSIFVTLFPGLGSGVATYFGVKTNQLDDDGYIMLNGAINTLVIALSFFAAIYLEKTRTGSSFYFLNAAEYTALFDPVFLFAIILISISVGFFLTMFFAKHLIDLTNKINQKTICLFALVLVIVCIILFSNLFGLIVAIIGTAIGIFTILSNNPRILMLSCIIFPVLLWFLI